MVCGLDVAWKGVDDEHSSPAAPHSSLQNTRLVVRQNRNDTPAASVASPAVPRGL